MVRYLGVKIVVRAKALWTLAAIVVVAAMLSACSLKKNTASTRNYMAFITRYNIYYNGDTHYKETLQEMESAYEDDYSQQLLFMHPVEAKEDSKAPQPTGDFTRSIEKAQKAIQLRSIKQRPKKKSGKQSDEYKLWLKRDEYNPFLHNAWMMMGRSQYYNGDFLGAASTFFYISKHFWWLPTTVTEAKIWQAKSYISMDWLFEGETILKRLKQDELTNNTLRGQYNFAYADYYLRSKELEPAVPYLQQAVKYAKGAQKTRLWFLLGQVYARLGKKTDAYEAFKKAGSAQSATYRTKFNARIKQSEVYTGENIEPEVKALKRMTRYDRNAQYLDQVYYAIGNLYLSRKDTTQAIENYVIACEKSTRNGIDKAIAQITLGQLYYERHQYELAQPCFSEAIPQLPESYPNYETLKKRSDVLDELALYSQNVTLNDSLLKLSNMSEEEQLKIINKIIDDLKKKEKEEEEAAKREAYLAEQAAQGSTLNSSTAPQTFTLNTDDSWYFYNTSSKNAGKTDFQKRWGSRKLEDDWRRRNKSSFDMSEFSSSEDEEDDEEKEGQEDAEGSEMTKEQKEAAEHENDPHFPEYYLKQIPKTDAERATCNDIIQEGLYNMGVILKDKLEDYPAAESEFNRLLTRYPDNVYRLDTYYNLYLMYARQGNTTEAEKYRLLIVNDFPESKYGQAMTDPKYLDNLKAMASQQEAMYNNAYEAYLDNNNAAVHRAYQEMRKKFPMSKLMPKFMFIEALSYVTEKNTEAFQSTLKELLELYPETDITPLASSYLKQLAKGRQLQSGAVNTRGMLWDMRLTNDSTAVANDSLANFELNPANPQLLVLTFPIDSVSSNQLLFDIARHNFNTFVVRDFDLEQMNFGRLGMLIIKGFDNMEQLDHYRRVMADDTQLQIPRQVRPIIISVKNFETLLREGRSFDEYFRYLEEQNYMDAQKDVLPPEVYGDPESLPELEEHIEEERGPQTEGPQPPETGASQASEASAPALGEPALDGQQEPKPGIPENPEIPEIPGNIGNPEKTVQKPTQQIPEYPEGSEGDDPLFDNP
ncbi:MAG: tetratricopeptide repeat protein [Bacteroidales bacterium]|nr:tetratricopeptide repeat protein [Bacteroidales bacterium]